MSDASERYATVQAILASARGLSGAELDRHLGTQCGDDATLRSAVLELLAADQAAEEDGFADASIQNVRSTLEQLADSATSAWLPERIGSYEIVRQIGLGGMGIVYEAKQRSPRRSVAIKLLHPIHETDDRLRRFRHEAELLGRLQHPGIAKIHESGTYDVGRGPQPFIAMELVEGEPLTQFATTHTLDARARIALLADVCVAVQHAHEHGIIHRDLKPANILVIKATTGSDGPQPKVLDFGIARTTDAGLQLSTLQTRTGQLLGTLSYMSPEQIAGHDGIDARSDVYALGVLLYELLAGLLPLDFEGRSLTEVGRIIRDEDPVPLGRIRREFRGDVETICDKALSKEPEYRYATAAALGEDLRRVLKNEPITARPQTTWYRLRKLARRNKALVSGVAATFTALTGGILVAVVLLFRAERGEAAAERRSYVAQITAATAIVGTDPVAARQALDAAPTELRGWEWDWLRSQTESVDHVFVPPEGQPCDVTFRPDGTLVCLTREGEAATLYDARSGAVLARLEIALVYHDAFLSRDGQRIGVESGEPIKSEGVLVGWNPLLRVLNATDGRFLAECNGPRWDWARVLDPHAAQFYKKPGGNGWSEISVALLSPDRRMSLQGTIHNRFVEIRDHATNSIRHKLEGHQAPIHAAAFTADSKRVITSCRGDSTVRIWATASGALLRTFRVDKPGRIAVARDGETIAVLSGGFVKLLSMGDRSSRVFPFDDYVYSVAVDLGRGLVVGRTHGSSIKMFDTWTGQEFGSWVRSGSHLAFSPDGRRVDLGGGEFLDVACLTYRPSAGSAAPKGLEAGCSSPDGSLRAIAEQDAVVVYDIETGQRRATLRGHVGRVMSLVFLPDGTRLVTAGNDQTVRLWDTVSFQQVAVLRGHTNYVKSLAVSHDGSWIASGSGDKTVRIWDRRSPSTRFASRQRAEAIWNEQRPRLFEWLVEFRDPGAVADRIAAETSLDPEQRAVLLSRLIRLIGFRDAPDTDPRARKEAYLALIAAAAGTWDVDAPLAWDYLERAPQALRGKEWHWIRELEAIHPVAHSYRGVATGESCVAFRQDGTPLYAILDDGQVTVLDVATGEIERVLEYAGGIERPVLSNDGTRLLAWGLEEGQPRHLLEWALPSGKLLTESRDCAHAGGAIVVGPSRHVAWGHPKLDPATNRYPLTIFDLDAGTAVLCQVGVVERPAFLVGGGEVACDSQLFDVRTGESTHAWTPRNTVWSPDGRYVGYSGFGLGGPTQLERIGRFEGNPGRGRPLTFSSGSRWFAATLAPAEKIAVWDVATRQRKLTVAASAIAFSPDEKQIVVATKDGAKVISLTGPTPASLRAAIDAARVTMQPTVARLFAELHDATAVMTRIEADRNLGAVHRRAVAELVFEQRLQALATALAR